MKRFILSCCISLLALFHAFGSENNFPLELQGAISCIDNSDLISKGSPVEEQEIRADYVMLDNDALSKVYYNILYWNTATGESRLYHFVDSASKFVLFREEMQLPTEPLGFNATGKVMADYEAVYNTKNNKAYYEILFWDTKTGKSKLYFFDDMTQNFKAYSSNVQLPSIPLFRTQGEVMAKYSAIYMSAQDKTIYEVLFWDTATGKSKL
ncbi:MAG: hypothetical protein MK066_14470, partial [Crocinitomicaceae bacterium]|nr:hypothetical protein [Crocinitomicaceae bacterium]